MLLLDNIDVSFSAPPHFFKVMDLIATEISKLNTKLDAIEQLLEKDYEEWTPKEKQKFGNHEQLRKKEEQLSKKEERLRKKEEQLRELLILQLKGIKKLTEKIRKILTVSFKNINRFETGSIFSSGQKIDPVSKLST
jgi:exonuclease VII large subunit